MGEKISLDKKKTFLFLEFVNILNLSLDIDIFKIMGHSETNSCI